MQRNMTIHLPDELYQPLLENAQKVGRTPEDVVSSWLAVAVRGLSKDALLHWMGAFSSDMTDISERHDHYLGQTLLEELRGNGHG
jgi:hypothetical protein